MVRRKIMFTHAGFTLIELLIVIAVLGTLAIVVLIALNPIQQLARARDSGRDSSVASLGRAMEARATVLGGQYPLPAVCPNASWVTDCLVTAGEINIVPGNANYSTGVANSCTGEGGWCYNATAQDFVIYTQAEADSNTDQCLAQGDAFFAYSSALGRAGLYCGGGGTPPAPAATAGWVQ